MCYVSVRPFHFAGPFRPVSPSVKVTDMPILHQPDEPVRVHPVHIQIKSKSDHYSKLREKRPPTPAPANMGRPTDDEEEQEAQDEVGAGFFGPRPIGTKSA